MSLIQGRRMSDYDKGWVLFASGQPLPLAGAPRPMVDGYNNARKAAIAFNKSMNAHAIEQHMAGLRSVLSLRVETRKQEGYRVAKDTRKHAFEPHTIRYEHMERFAAFVKSRDAA